MADHGVEGIAMGDEEAFAVGGGVLGFHLHFYAANFHTKGNVFAHHLVMVAGDVDDIRAIARRAKNKAQDFVVMVIPEPGAAQAPAVDDVTHEKQVFACY
ncbi:hypothetical protein GCM10010909_34630 [Acidocella aquatica]|uniref:VOC domain-containing protein n=1 Tax=Acidocella aquatica TaxID=1922313 RepID=A0ABQ6A9A3_9PROT|nr:hypothetical protein GCM10010909_34630 [Acidocella aquatica]